MAIARFAGTIVQLRCPLLLSQKSCRTKVSRIFRIFVPNFAPNFAPNFPRIFRGLFVLRLVGDGDQKKFTKNPRHFSMQNPQANTEKLFTKCFWRGGKVTYYSLARYVPWAALAVTPPPLQPLCFGIGDWGEVQREGLRCLSHMRRLTVTIV